MRMRHLFKSSAAVAACLLMAGNAFGYEDVWHGAGLDGNWATDANWESPSYPGSHFAPDSGSSVVISDQYVTANVTLYTGWGSTISDFTMYSNFGSGGDSSFTMKSGTSLHSTHNFDLGYFGGAESNTFTMETGTTLTVDGYYGGGHVGPSYSIIAGAINTGSFAIGGGDFVHFKPTAIVTAKGDQYTTGDISSDLASWIGSGQLTTDSGYQLVYSYDSNTQLNTISVQAVPEPASLGLLAAGGLLMLRRRKA